MFAHQAIGTVKLGLLAAVLGPIHATVVLGRLRILRQYTSEDAPNQVHANVVGPGAARHTEMVAVSGPHGVRQHDAERVAEQFEIVVVGSPNTPAQN